MNQKLRQMRELGGAEGAATSLHILNALSDHHVLDRVEYPEVTYRFEHQQMQEYYAAEFFKARVAHFGCRSWPGFIT